MVRARDNSLSAIIDAFDEAIGKALKRIVEWAVQVGSRPRLIRRRVFVELARRRGARFMALSEDWSA